jgi:stage V sporulation protein SpoVS
MALCQVASEIATGMLASRAATASKPRARARGTPRNLASRSNSEGRQLSWRPQPQTDIGVVTVTSNDPRHYVPDIVHQLQSNASLLVASVGETYTHCAMVSLLRAQQRLDRGRIVFCPQLRNIPVSPADAGLAFSCYWEQSRPRLIATELRVSAYTAPTKVANIVGKTTSIGKSVRIDVSGPVATAAAVTACAMAEGMLQERRCTLLVGLGSRRVGSMMLLELCAEVLAADHDVPLVNATTGSGRIDPPLNDSTIREQQGSHLGNW